MLTSHLLLISGLSSQAVPFIGITGLVSLSNHPMNMHRKYEGILRRYLRMLFLVQLQLLLPEEIRNRFSYKYHGGESRVQAKFSVSDISKDSSGYGLVLKRPDFMKEHSGMTGTERGTAVHSILQHADFSMLGTDPEGEISRAADNGFITRHQAEEISPEYIRAFTGSEIYRRALASGKISRERKFLVRISDLELKGEEFRKFDSTGSMVQGIVDMYFEEDDGLVLVDYKTDSVTDILKLAEKYRTQLEIYRAALETMENKKVKQTFIYSLKLSQAAVIE